MLKLRLGLAVVAVASLVAALAADEGTIDGLNKGTLRVRVSGKLHTAEVRSIKMLDASGKPLDNRGILAAAKKGTKVDVKLSEGKVVEVRLLGDGGAKEPPKTDPDKKPTSPSSEVKPAQPGAEPGKDPPLAGVPGVIDGLNKGTLRVRVSGKLHAAEVRTIKMLDASGKPLDSRGILAAAKKGSKVDVKFSDGKVVEVRLLGDGGAKEPPKTDPKKKPMSPPSEVKPVQPGAEPGKVPPLARTPDDADGPKAPPRRIQMPKNVSQSELQKAIDSANAGDAIALAVGTTTIREPLILKSNVSLVGPDEGFAELDASAADGPVILFMNYLDGITLRRLQFRNVGLHFNGDAAHKAGKNLTVEECRFLDLKRFPKRPSAFIRATCTTNMTIKNCVFLRTAAHHGVGVQFWRAHHSVLEGCKIGEDGKDFPAVKYGHFKTAVYGNGWESDQKGDDARCVDLQIRRNHIRRSVEADAEEDHGIYVLGAKGLIIEDNDIAGWTTKLTGGAIKVRDGENYVVRRNTCADSGILLYNYKNCVYPFVDVVVSHNKIRIAKQEGDTAYFGATGITYWRDDPDSTERNIRIEDNSVENGKIMIYQPVNVADFNKSGGGVRRNRADVILLPQGIISEGNVPRLPNWMPPKK